MVGRKDAWVGALVALLLMGCPGETPADTDDESSGGGVPTTAATVGDGPTGDTAADTSVQTGDVTGDPSTGPGPDTTSGSGTDTTENPPATGGIGVDCPSEPQTLECGDGIDNDGDGAIDLFDPECVSPCDDDESSFQTGLPGDNMDCMQDCFFDGNSGHGDDGCQWNLTCDPANPGAGLEPVSCDYNPGPQCDNMAFEPSQECIDFCTPLVPPGCDCFGCCEVQTEMGSVWIFLNSEPPCSLENLDACNECTPQIEECGVPCVPEECVLCFGETELPEGCKDNVCPGGGQTCDFNEDCPQDFFCFLDCCYPPPQP